MSGAVVALSVTTHPTLFHVVIHSFKAATSRLLIGANDRTAKLVNGETDEVTSMANGRIGLRDGRTVDPARFVSFSHGYAVTSHKSQSQTVDEVIVAERSSAQNRPMSPVHAAVITAPFSRQMKKHCC